MDSIFAGLSQEEKIGQLFMVAAYSNKTDAHIQEIEALIKEQHIGGLIFFQGNPRAQATLTNRYQGIAEVPLLIGMDAEWGLGMRLDSTMNFPRQLTLGAIQDNQLLYQMGREIARQCKILGVHVNFAPVVDVNNNPANPVINDRSFGENKYNVAQKGLAYMKGLQDGGVLACAKHFPGHGDTDMDSHKSLPTIPHNASRLDSLELYPFKQLINNGVGSIMAAHLYIPSLDSSSNTAVSLSKNVVTDLLKTKLKFKGLVFTDALNMKGVSSYFTPGEVDLKALLAGNDVLLFPEDVPTAINKIKQAIKDSLIQQSDLDKKVKNILKTKYWTGLNDNNPIAADSVNLQLNTMYAELLNRKLYESALTIAKNEKATIPLKNLDKLNIASIVIANRKNEESVFQKTLNLYAPMRTFRVDKSLSQDAMSALEEQAAAYNTVIIGVQDMSKYLSKEYGITETTRTLINNLSKKTNVILTIFGSPYSLKYFENVPNILVAYEDNDITQSLAAQLIFGGVKASGKLPVSAGENFKYNTGETSMNTGRLKYTIPEEVGISTASLSLIDSIIKEAILNHATPGCQILIAKDNKVIFNRGYGYHTYDNKTIVRPTDIYDLASITKVAATTLAIMKLVDEKEIKVKKNLSNYIPELKKTDKSKISIQDVLLHQAGLKAWIPFYEYTLNAEGFCDENYCYSPNDYYSVKVANELYIQHDYTDSIWNTILNSEVNRSKRYVYSDLGFYLCRTIVENITKQPIDKYVNNIFYKPLGLATMTYNPIYKFPLSRIPPTEMDTVFRKQLIHGYVHDQGAAMLGGVAGHAGLFSDANDLAIILQMLLNGGSYGYQDYIDPNTIEEFTSRQINNNRRGLGFDKPETDPSYGGPTSKYASAKTFGHSGFTGTCMWADPAHNLTYVFLSNRVYPDASNRTLIQTDVRTRIHDVIYKAMLEAI